VLSRNCETRLQTFNHDYCTVKLDSGLCFFFIVVKVLSILLERHCDATRYQVVPHAILYEVV